MTGAVIHLSVPSGDPIPHALLELAIRLTLESESHLAAEVSVAFLSDEEARRMNRVHLDHDWIPDVLSFQLHGPGEPPHADLYVGLEQARRQAREEGVPEAEELVRLVVHGLLHTLGWDHPEDPAARPVSPHYRRQEELVTEILAEYRESADASGPSPHRGPSPSDAPDQGRRGPGGVPR